MLVGNAVHSLDTKGRIVIPAKYRDDFGSTVYALYGVKGCIRLYPYEQFMKLTEKLQNADITKDALRRRIFGSVDQISIDTQGRILLSEGLRNKAGITDKVWMYGMYQWLELWNKDQLADQESDFTAEEEIRQMEELGLA